MGARVAQAPDILADVHLAPTVRQDAPVRLVPSPAKAAARALQSQDDARRVAEERAKRYHAQLGARGKRSR